MAPRRVQDAPWCEGSSAIEFVRVEARAMRARTAGQAASAEKSALVSFG